MNRKTIWIACAALLLPILLRLIWFYPGFGFRPKIATPDYPAMTAPAPPLESPQPDQDVEMRGGVVVIDAYHANVYLPSEIESLTEALTLRGARVEYDDVSGMLETRLKYASAYVVISPSLPFSADEIRTVQAFVARGGRLVVFTDATRGQLATDYITGNTMNFPDVNGANPLLAPFGITINNDYLYNLDENEGNFRNVFFDQFGKHELALGLKRVAFYGTHSLRSDTGLILFPEAEHTVSSLTDAHLSSDGAAALSADGNVLAFGDFTFLTIPYDHVADNHTLIDNIADFMLGSERQSSLADFPYIFHGSTLSILPTSEVQMTAELVGALSRLQIALRPVNVRVEIAEKAPADGDVLVLGTYTPSDDLLEYTDPFDLVLDDFAEYVEVPDFGKVGRTGNGLLLFETGSGGNTLVLLADGSTDLASLLDSLTGGSMSGCLIQEKVGVCSIGFGGSFSDGPGLDFEITPEGTLPEDFPLEPLATPTAAG